MKRNTISATDIEASNTRAAIVRMIVIGNNVAGTTLAKSLRDADPSVDIDIYTDESMPYYARPKLIDYLVGTVEEKDMPFYPSEWYAKNRLNLHLSSRVERIDPSKKQILVQGAWHPYDKLALATGSSSFVPPFKGMPKDKTYTLRTIEDARSIRKSAADSKHVIVIGGGLLGLESARAICSAFPHLKVTILEYAEHLLMRQLDHEGATLLQGWIEKTGARIVTKAETDEILGSASVEGVKLKDGRVIDGDMLIVSAGTRSNMNIAKDAGLKVNKGIIVDSSLRTSDPDIYAIGDVCEFQGQVWAMIPPALDEARVAAKKMLGQTGPDYAGTIPSNTLKISGFDLTSIGVVRSAHEPPDPGFEEIRAVTPDGSIYKKFVIKDGRMIGAIILGTKKEALRVTKIIREGQPMDKIRPMLSDPSYSFA